MAYPLLQQAGQGYLLQILGSTPTLSSLSSQTATTTASELSYQSPLCSEYHWGCSGLLNSVNLLSCSLERVI